MDQSQQLGVVMYVKFDGGTRNPGGYVVPCDVVKTFSWGALVVLSSADGAHEWRQYVNNSELLTDEEAERDEV